MTRIPGAIADLTGRGPDAGGPYNYSYYDNDKNSKNNDIISIKTIVKIILIIFRKYAGPGRAGGLG